MTDDSNDTLRSEGASRRSLLRLGAGGVPAVFTVKPAFAAQTSVLLCEIPIDNWVDKHGKIVAAGTEGAFPPPARPYIGEELRKGTSPHKLAYERGMDQEAVNAHLAYIRNTVGKGKAEGLTCLASIMGP